ncbi:uncharacterized protein LOC143214412 [Lasioglossum baleicum]|uniref:uncharacterized protein LOC143214412 n=1 Tax=Lasioglossum baleicum TaxID=434251 RepID=UPI003FCEC46F
MARSWIVRLAGLAIGSCGTILYLLNDSVKAGGQSPTELPSYPWRFSRMFQTFDHAALRRGWQVYRTVCSTCHSLQFVRFMDLIDATHTAAEARAIAEEYEVTMPYHKTAGNIHM